MAGSDVNISAPILCTLFDGDQHKCEVLVALKRTTAAISLFGCIFMISIIWLFKKYRIFTQRMILYLSISSFFISIAYLMGDLHPDGSFCDFQAWALTYFDWTGLLWVSCITFNLYWNAIKNKRTDQYEWIYHVVCWAIPLLISFVPFINNHYGPAGAWCWIKGNWLWRFFVWYGPLFLIILLLFLTYIYIIVKVHQKSSNWEGLYDPDVEQSKERLKEEVKPLRIYPFVYLAVSIFPLINRIQNAISDKPVFALMVLHVIFAPLQGVMNAVVFGLDKETRQRLTYSQIKMSFVGWFTRDDQLIREFPTQVQDPNQAL